MTNTRPADFPTDAEIDSWAPLNTLAALLDAFVGNDEWMEHDIREQCEADASARKQRKLSCAPEHVEAYRYAQVEQRVAAKTAKVCRNKTTATYYDGLSAGYAWAIDALRRGGVERLNKWIDDSTARENERRADGLTVDVYGKGMRYAMRDIAERADGHPGL